MSLFWSVPDRERSAVLSLLRSGLGVDHARTIDDQCRRSLTRDKTPNAIDQFKGGIVTPLRLVTLVAISTPCRTWSLLYVLVNRCRGLTIVVLSRISRLRPLRED